MAALLKLRQAAQRAATISGIAQDAAISGQRGSEIVLQAVKEGNNSLLQRALERHGESDLCQTRDDVDNNTLLHWAALRGDSDCIDTLLSHSVDVNARNEQGSVPLSWAAMNGHISALQRLIEAGADIDPCDALGLTPLLLAVQSSQHLAALYLIEHGADALASDASGCTAAHWAAFHGDVRTLQLLAALGHTDLFAMPDAEGYLPVHRAAKVGQPRAVLWFLEHASVDPRIRLGCVLGLTHKDSHQSTSAFTFASLCRSVRKDPTASIPHPGSLLALANESCLAARQTMDDAQISGVDRDKAREAWEHQDTVVRHIQSEASKRDRAEASMRGAAARLCLDGLLNAKAIAKVAGPLCYFIFLLQCLGLLFMYSSGAGSNLGTKSLFCILLALLFAQHVGLYTGRSALPVREERGRALADWYRLSPWSALSSGLSPMHRVYPSVRRVLVRGRGVTVSETTGVGETKVQSQDETEAEDVSCEDEDEDVVVDEDAPLTGGRVLGGPLDRLRDFSGLHPHNSGGRSVETEAGSGSRAENLAAAVFAHATRLRALYPGQDLAASMAMASHQAHGSVAAAPPGSCMAIALSRVCWVCLRLQPVHTVHDATIGQCVDSYHLLDPVCGAIVDGSSGGLYCAWLCTHALSCVAFLSITAFHVQAEAQQGAAIVALVLERAGANASELPSVDGDAAVDVAAIPTTVWAVLAAFPVMCAWILSVSVALIGGLLSLARLIYAYSSGLTVHEARVLACARVPGPEGAMLPPGWYQRHRAVRTRLGEQGLQAGGCGFFYGVHITTGASSSSSPESPPPSGVLLPRLSNPFTLGSGYANLRASCCVHRGLPFLLRVCLPLPNLYPLLALAGYRHRGREGRARRASTSDPASTTAGAVTVQVANEDKEAEAWVTIGQRDGRDADEAARALHALLEAQDVGLGLPLVRKRIVAMRSAMAATGALDRWARADR